ncbi:aminodeoxychorismate synthase component I [Kushneria indalinina]|uniref:aminodeoxychorismate synthase n=1 Tax=Kushneria indalinina DSM 14324 TaxID=1122140 RepID=A0A3D9DUS6_9GAMM|nr:aminodeoxychorismate synthase component I [Kushneria indalinina]REC94528.1 aminodeoxychorismate synthase subunit I [Kushneria indalinina DSM 14324]
MSSNQLLLHSLPYQADPAGWFERLRHRPEAMLLDSGRPYTQTGRFDIMSSDPMAVLEVDPLGRCHCTRALSAIEPLAAQRELLQQLETTPPETTENVPFTGGLMGYWSYDFGRLLERLESRAAADIDLPLARLGLYDWALIQDHQQQCSYLVATTERRDQVLTWLEASHEHEDIPFALTSPFAADIDRATYGHRFQRVSDYLHAGDCYQVNLAQRFQARCRGDSWEAYCRLRHATPAPFGAWLSWQESDGRERSILSLSPERFLHLQDRQLTTSPIKGTRPRGRTAEEDQQLADELVGSLKDRTENVMIVDLLRNDLGRVCRAGTVRVPALAALESYRNVHHLVSTITGKLAPDLDAIDALAAAFPGGSITGAPRIRAMDIIDELEGTRRGPYCGSVGYIDQRGAMHTSITIRTLYREDDTLYVWGGGGLVADSDEESEYIETLDKIRHLMRALA